MGWSDQNEQWMNEWALNWPTRVLLMPAWCSCFLPQSKDMRVRLIGDSKLPVGVSVSGCLSLYVGPATDWRPVQGTSPAPAPPPTLTDWQFLLAMYQWVCWQLSLALKTWWLSGKFWSYKEHLFIWFLRGFMNGNLQWKYNNRNTELNSHWIYKYVYHACVFRFDWVRTQRRSAISNANCSNQALKFLKVL